MQLFQSSSFMQVSMPSLYFGGHKFPSLFQCELKFKFIVFFLKQCTLFKKYFFKSLACKTSLQICQQPPFPSPTHIKACVITPVIQYIYTMEDYAAVKIMRQSTCVDKKRSSRYILIHKISKFFILKHEGFPVL